MSETDLLQEIVDDPIPADKGLRFANLIIDVICSYAFIFAVGLALILAAPDLFINDSGAASLLLNVISISLYLIYFTLLEGLTKGRTIGKFVTGTKAAKLDGSPISMGDAFKRSLSRLVPFEPFSAFGDKPWHDRWTDTVVTKINR